HQAAQAGAEIGPHHPLARLGAENDADRLLDVILISGGRDFPCRVDRDRESPAPPEKFLAVRRHGRSPASAANIDGGDAGLHLGAAGAQIANPRRRPTSELNRRAAFGDNVRWMTGRGRNGEALLVTGYSSG